MSKILVIGGSYFAGRIFSLEGIYEGHSITVVNRGRYSMKDADDRIIERKCDRRDVDSLKHLELEESYDAIVDFCGYEPGDVRSLLENIPCKFEKYIFVSTPDVIAPSKEPRSEESPVLQEQIGGEVGAYAWKKLQLEKELKEVAAEKDITYTILRPAFIFGPYNYAPRESFFIENIIKQGRVPFPTDAVGKFNLVYVKDLALAIYACIENDKANNETFIVSAPDVLDYAKFIEVLKSVSDTDFEVVEMTCQEATAQMIALPFPFTEDENEIFDGSKISRELGFEYSDLLGNMKKTFEAFSSVYR